MKTATVNLEDDDSDFTKQTLVSEKEQNKAQQPLSNSVFKNTRNTMANTIYNEKPKLSFLQKNSITQGLNSSRKPKEQDNFVVAKNSTGKVIIPKINFDSMNKPRDSNASSNVPKLNM